MKVKRVLVTIETDAVDSDGETYPHPRHWDWEELIGGNTVFIASTPAASRPPKH